MTASGGTPRIVVVGGGLAGLSAAVECADSGAAVTLLEGRPRLGGATWSFSRHGLHFDNGQHVHLRCCEAYRSWLDRLGTGHLAPIEGPLAIPVIRPSTGPDSGRPHAELAWIRRSNLPAPLHLARSLLCYRHLRLSERFKLLGPALRLRGVDLDDPQLDAESFGAFLERHGQATGAINRLWDLITLPTTNLRAGDVSLSLAAKVFQTGLLTSAPAADIGWSRVPLADLHVEPAARLIARLGGEVIKRARVTEIRTDGGRVTGVATAGGAIAADAVVLATQHQAAADLLPPASRVDPAALRRLGTAPIVNVHVVFDRKVMGHQMAAAVDSPVQFVFDRTAAAGLDPSSGKQVLAVSISGADDVIGASPDSLIERYVTGLRELFPVPRGTSPPKVLDAVVTREHEATFRGAPGSRALRCGPATGIENLSLAGAWTDTGWPATMEGAVRSGRAAAAVALRSVGRHRSSSSPPREEVPV